MSFAANFPLICVLLCLLSAAVSAVLPRRAAGILSRCLTLAVAVLSCFVLILGLRTGQTTAYTLGHFPHPWGNELRFGLLEPLFSGAFALVMLSCVTGGKRFLDQDVEPEKQNLYFAMTDLILASLFCLIYTNDVFTGYVFIEICTISACGILMIRQLGRTTLASVRYMIFSLIGSGLFLLGVILLYSITGHLLMPDLKPAIAELWRTGEYHVPLVSAICLMVVGLGIKSGLFPFHFWMPDTYGYSTPCSAGILSGLVTKGYILLLIRVIFNVFGTEVFYASGVQNLLYGFGVAGMVVGSVTAMRENDINRMIADSSAAQIGYIYMGIGISPTLGVLAALFHILTHALTKPALFLSAAHLVEASGGRRRFKLLQGSAHKNKIAGMAFALGSLSMIGLPLTMGFIAKYLFALAAFREEAKLIPTLLALAVSTVLNTFYFSRTLIRVYNTRGLEPFRPVRLRDQRSYAAAAGLLAALNVFLGVIAQPLIDLLNKGLALMG